MNGPRLSIIPARAATDRRLKPRDLQVLCVLGRHTDDLGWCRRSQVKMAEEMGCARSTVYEAIERLVKNGYLEKHEKHEPSGRDSAHIYRVILDPVHPNLAAVENLDAAATPADIPAPPAGPEPAPPAGPEPAPINDPCLTTPTNVERDARESDGQEAEPAEAAAVAADDERPGSAAFEKRVMRFCNGRGFSAGKWPDWDTSSPSWIGRHFAQLAPEDRAEAERWRDAYLLDIADRGKKPVVVGNFLRGKFWQGLDPTILKRAEDRKAARLKPEDRPKPDGWASCLGPVGMAWLFAKLLAGADDPQVAARPFLTEAQLREAWPAVWWFQAKLRQPGSAAFDDRWHALKDAMEPVPQGTEALAAWKATFAERGWRWLAPFDRADVVYCPKGGQERLHEFEQAVRGQGNDAGGQQAAE